MCITLDVVVAKKGQDIMEGELGRSDAYKCQLCSMAKATLCPPPIYCFCCMHIIIVKEKKKRISIIVFAPHAIRMPKVRTHIQWNNYFQERS